MKMKIQVVAVILLAILTIALAQSQHSKKEASIRESRFLPFSVINKVASFFRSDRHSDFSTNDKTSRFDFIPQVEKREENKRNPKRAEGSRSSVLSFRVFNPLQNIFKMASSTIVSVASKIKDNLPGRILLPSTYLTKSQKEDEISDRTSLANIIAKDISMNLEEEMERNKKNIKYDFRKITDAKKSQKLESKVKNNLTKFDTQIQMVGEKYQNENSKSQIQKSKIVKIEEETGDYDPFYSIKDADPEIVRHFDPNGDSTQFLIGERKEPRADPISILYNLYSAWGGEPDEEKYDARGWHMFN